MSAPAALRDSEHLPSQPDWRCSSCDTDWPCPIARNQLVDEYRRDPIAVGMYLCGQMHQAIIDLGRTPEPGLTPAGFYVRFLAFVRPDG